MSRSNFRSGDGVATIGSFTNSQTGASLLANIVLARELGPTILAATSGETPSPEVISLIERLTRRAKFKATLAKMAGSICLLISLIFLCAALLWPAIEKFVLHWQESIWTGLGQIGIGVLGSLAAGGYLAAKRPQSRIEDSLRRLLFEHAPLSERVAQLEFTLGTRQPAPDASSAARSKSDAMWSARTTEEVRRKLEPLLERPVSEGEAMVFAAQLKEARIKVYGWRTISRTTSASALGLFALALALPAIASLQLVPIDADMIGTMQPLLGVALPVFLLSIRQQARGKLAQVQLEIDKCLQLPERLDAKTERLIETMRIVDRGMTTFAHQVPQLGTRSTYE